ncbi:MAG: pentapeptide repeat-containing protein [Bacteroidota bacterium]
MANQHHLDILSEGRESWNQWRELEPDETPDLSVADLRDIRRRFDYYDFSYANLKGARMGGRSFRKTNFTGAVLRNANFEEAKLIEAIFVEADLTYTRFNEAIIDKADFQGAILNNTRFQKASLGSANLSGTDLRNTKFNETNLRRGILTNCNLSGLKLSEIELSYAQLEGSNLSKSRIYESKLWHANLKNCQLSETRISDVDLRQADLDNAIIMNSKFISCNLRNTKLTNLACQAIEIKNSDLTSSNFENSIFKKSIFSHNNLKRTKFLNTDFADSKILGCHFEKSRIKGLNLKKVEVSESHFIHCKFDETDFSYATMGSDVFAFTNFTTCIGLDQVEVTSECSIDIHSIMSVAPISMTFLKNLGLPTFFLNYLTDNPPPSFHSVFISHSSEDKEFVWKLHKHLKMHGVEVWIDDESLSPGDELRKIIFEKINSHDKTILVCSKASLNSSWVTDEINKTLDKDEREKKGKGIKNTSLIPISIDDYIHNFEGPFSSIIKSRKIGDFRDWRDDNSFKDQFQNLINGLQTSLD